MNAIILSVGDELVLGQTVDTNSAWISQQLAAIGCDIIGHRTVGDDQALIEIAIAEAASLADVIIVSGGIGPTEDDLTRQAIAAVNEVELVVDEKWLAEIEGFFRKLGRRMPETNRIQAMIPAGAQLLWNTCGTAAGVMAMIKSIDVEGEDDNEELVATEVPLFATPGVPKEMKAMFTRDVLPWLKQRTGGAVILSRILHTFGQGESAVAEKLGELMTRGRNPSVGTTVSGGIVSLRLNARYPSLEEATAKLEETAARCHAELGDLIYGQDDVPLATVVARLLLQDPSHPTVATAESCTGGLVARMLTDIPGSSAYFKYGWVTYANQAKTDLLGVPAQTLIDHGAVSEATVLAMAKGARDRAGATYALSLSGIAGPDGGTPEKPVGTVWIALAHTDGVTARRFILTGDREMIRDRAAKMALTMLRFRLLGKELPF
ncbi:competence/damage-inducible protein A [Humisphaera borealis]|uniref:CinA-like protein n=1 Tax=Humisphaera borealis TaxID=2807512 RepID=A0A7M2X349_9BACT|nr:competence/damage-inducible protein A [Humisphaera borealis]QOV91190.1 competence/damage-inducible protein A [Humisphaera borealis]